MEASINLPTEIASLQTIPISVAQEHHSPEKDAITDTDRSISAFLDLVRTEGLTRDPDPINSSQTDEPRPPDKTVRENIHTDETEETQLVTNAELMNNTKKKPSSIYRTRVPISNRWDREGHKGTIRTRQRTYVHPPGLQGTTPL